MKLLIFSDIHGRLDSLLKIIEIFKLEKYDSMIILGDVLYHGPRNNLPENYNPKECIKLLNQYSKKIVWIKGNCDAYVDEMVLNFKAVEKLSLNINGSEYYFEHGHLLDFDNLEKYKAQYIVYGHFHVPMLYKKNGFTLANPGSISIPKDGSVESYICLEEGIIEIKNLFD